MKRSDLFFWSILIIIALFLVFKGNDMHREYYDMIAQKNQQIHQEKQND